MYVIDIKEVSRRLWPSGLDLARKKGLRTSYVVGKTFATFGPSSKLVIRVKLLRQSRLEYSDLWCVRERTRSG